MRTRALDATSEQSEQSKNALPGNSSSQTTNTTNQEDSLAAKAVSILEVKCAGCHNPESAAISAFDYVTHIEKLIDQKMLIPGSTAESKLYQRIEDGTMPPEGSPALTEKEMTTLQQWITAGTPITVAEANTTESERRFIHRSEIFAAAITDLQKIPDNLRRNIRYLSAASFYNSGASNNMLAQAETGINKLLNTFSTSTNLTRAQSVHIENILFRVNLQDFNIPTTKWETIEIFYPYHFVTDDTSEHAYLQNELNTTLPIMRIDWFLSATGKPPLYYNMLDTPETLSELETQLGINRLTNIRNKKVIRAGFNNSMVAENHRVIERHSTNSGFMWISYEFGSLEAEQNIFSNPLGPTGAFPQTTTSRQFNPGGHELFYTRPNGMLAFAVYNFAGSRMHEAPALIKEDGKVINKVVAGKTCHICHGNGPIFKEDQVRDRAMNNLNATEKDLLQSLYVTHSAFQTQITADSHLYAGSLKKIGIAAGLADPIASVSKYYDDPLTFKLVGAELSISEATLRKLVAEDEALAKIIAECQIAAATETFDRSCFTRKFKTIAQRVWQ